MRPLTETQTFPLGTTLSLARMEQPGEIVLQAVFTRYEDGLLVLRLESPKRGLAAKFPPGTRLIARSGDGTTPLVAQISVVGGTDAELVARVPVQIDRFTKRRFHRAPVDLPLSVRGQACRALDLSGCGLLAHCPREAQVLHGDIVEALLSLPDGRTVAIRMHAVRTGEGPFGSRLVGFDFVDIKERDQDRVVAYVLQQERRRVQALRGL